MSFMKCLSKSLYFHHPSKVLKKYVPLLLSFFFLELLSFPEKAACAPANGKMEVVGDENEKLSDAKENNI